MTLIRDLTTPQENFSSFKNLTIRVLRYVPDVVSSSEVIRGYTIWSSTMAGATRYVRPINDELFVSDPDAFALIFDETFSIFTSIKQGHRSFSPEERFKINSTLYTIQQAIGAGFDLLSNPNSARKHVGNRFEELIRSVFSAIGIANKKVVLQIPYETESGQDVYKCENDIILSGSSEVQSNRSDIERSEVVVSVKTTSKDRMGKIFIDKLLLQNFTNKDIKMIGIIHNDVQRKESNNISYTLVPRLFLVYTKFLTQLEGIYYLDMPPIGRTNPFKRHIKLVSDLLIDDIWIILKT